MQKIKPSNLVTFRSSEKAADGISLARCTGRLLHHLLKPNANEQAFLKSI